MKHLITDSNSLSHNDDIEDPNTTYIFTSSWSSLTIWGPTSNLYGFETTQSIQIYKTVTFA